MEMYQPSAIVLHCGGNSLSGDQLGSFNVSMIGHASCVKFIRLFGLPLLMLGGKGFTIRNVSRTWAYDTGSAASQELCTVPASDMEDMNLPQYLEKVKMKIFEYLRHTIHAPSVAIPKLSYDNEMEVDKDLDDPNDWRPHQWVKVPTKRDMSIAWSIFEIQRNRLSNVYTLAAAFNPDGIVIFKALSWLGLNVPYQMNYSAKDAKKSYPRAVSPINDSKLKFFDFECYVIKSFNIVYS
ncbi:hypothetical protein BY996DRAFT_6417045 [Phakopsora pachyrhizi]|nr:hypothetical protein BY996DRAFT_6417045 [Phakopsora pachyrhizi]